MLNLWMDYKMDITKAKVAQADKIIGKPGTLHGNKDSDGDGVSNLMDCQPNNPHKQGMIHNLAAKGAKLVGANKTAEYIKEREVVYDQGKAREENIKMDAKKVENQAYYEKKKEVTMAKAKERGTQRAEGGSGFGSFVKKYVDQPNKKGFVTKKKNVTMPNIFGAKATGNSQQIPSLFNTNKGKEKVYKVPKIF